MREQLAPDLEAESYPIDLTRHPLFQAKHRQLARGVVELRSLDGPFRRGSRDQSSEIFKILRIVVPIAAEVTEARCVYSPSTTVLRSRRSSLCSTGPSTGTTTSEIGNSRLKLAAAGDNPAIHLRS